VNKRYQVFVSSTYADLKEERHQVTQAIMEMDCIPAGMELFPAMDEEQWEFIRKVIDDCDYYLLIIGGRYGSLTPEGISYTEKEYDYAVEIGVKVIAFIHQSPDDLPVAKSDIAPELREKLQAFRDKVATGRLVKFWTDPKELPGLVALSLSKTIKAFPAVGWMRASAVANEELLLQLNDVRNENASLRSELAKVPAQPSGIDVPDLADISDSFEVTGTYWSDHGKRDWKYVLTWQDIFSIVSPYLAQHPNQDYVKEILKAEIIKRGSISDRSNNLNDQDMQTIAVQFLAFGLIKTIYSKTIKGGMAMFWSFTPAGERLMIKLRAIRKKP
jgi:hypothetical protein